MISSEQYEVFRFGDFETKEQYQNFDGEVSSVNIVA